MTNVSMWEFHYKELANIVRYSDRIQDVRDYLDEHNVIQTAEALKRSGPCKRSDYTGSIKHRWGSRRLTPEQVKEARRLVRFEGHTLLEASRILHVSQSTLGSAIRGRPPYDEALYADEYCTYGSRKEANDADIDSSTG